MISSLDIVDARIGEDQGLQPLSLGGWVDAGGIREDTASAKEQSWVKTESRFAVGNGVSTSDTEERGCTGHGHLG